MNPERWRRIEQVCHEALEREPRERAAFLDEACAGDADLRREVESLIDQQSAAQRFLETPPAGQVAGDASWAETLLHDFDRAALTPGTRLGPYEITARIGAGGMGEVYKARDTRLGRSVALKVLSARVSSDPAFRMRFEREAHAIAALNHPHICTLYDVGHEGGIDYLVMEYLGGETLEARLDQGPVPIERAVDIAADVASALEKAHREGIIHRDLKPANLMFTDEGQIKILDLGLAKRPNEGSTSPTASNVTTLSPGVLTNGIILGTVGYMSPEQAAGEPAQPASDQFSFGVIVYEMLTGRRAFQRETPVETLAAILREEAPPIADLNPHVPAALRSIVERCLAKDPAERFSTTAELVSRLEQIEKLWSRGVRETALDDALSSPDSTGPDGPTMSRPVVNRRTALWLAGASIVTVVGTLVTRRLWLVPSTIRALAVLPFVNAANDADVEYLCDGLTEGVIQRMARLSSVKVMAQSTIFNFKGKAVDAREAGRQLGVEAVLSGTVARRSGRLVVSAELVEVSTGAQLWSERYDRAATDVLSVQEEIVRSIVEDGIRLRLGSDDRRLIAERPTNDPEAYELYLRARQALLRDTSEDYLTARMLLRQAIERDGRFAAAHASLSGTYALMILAGFERPTESWPSAIKSGRRALALDPDLPEAHREAATVAFYFEWDWPRAEREWKASIESRGGSVDPGSLESYALGCWALGRTAEAVRLAREARGRDPVTPAFTLRLANYLLYAGSVDEAVSFYEKAIQDGPQDDRAYFGLALARRAQGRFDEAIEARRRGAVAIGDEALLDAFPSERGEAGYRRLELVTAQLELETLEARAAATYVSPLDFARAYAQLGERERAFSYFDAAFADRAPDLVFLNAERRWDAIRNDPRFVAAVHRVGLP
jgi:serine/threonine-protein kinase